MRTFITLVLIFIFISFANSAWFCADDKCSVPMYEAKAIHARPPHASAEINVEKGDRILVYVVSNDTNYYLVKKKKEDDKLSTLPTSVLKKQSSLRNGVPISDSYFKQLILEKLVNSSNVVESLQQSVSRCSSEKLNIFLKVNDKSCPCKNNTQSMNYSQQNIQESPTSTRTTADKISKDENINTTKTIVSSEEGSPTAHNIHKDENIETKETTGSPTADEISKDKNIESNKTLVPTEEGFSSDDVTIEVDGEDNTTVGNVRDNNASLKEAGLDTKPAENSENVAVHTADKESREIEMGKNIESNETLMSTEEGFSSDNVTIKVDGENNTTIGNVRDNNASLKEAGLDTKPAEDSENVAVHTADKESREIKMDPHKPDLSKMVKLDFDSQIIDEEREINETLNYDIQKISDHSANQHENIKNASMDTSGQAVLQPKNSAPAIEELVVPSLNSSEDKSVVEPTQMNENVLLNGDPSSASVRNGTISTSVLKDEAEVDALQVLGEPESNNKNENISTDIPEVDTKQNFLDESNAAASSAQTLAPRDSKIPDTANGKMKSVDERETEHPTVGEKEATVSYNNLYEDNAVYGKLKPEYVPSDGIVQEPAAQPSSPTPIFAPQGNSNSEEIKDFGDGSPKNMPSYPEKDTNVYTIIGNPEKLKEEISFHTTTVEQKEEPFYEIFFEYMSNFSTIFYSPESYFNFNWLSKRSSLWENQNCNAEDNYECSTLENVNDGFVFGAAKIDIPFWGPVGGDFLIIYCGLCLSIFLLGTIMLHLVSTSAQNKRIRSLVAVINKLEKKLLVATKEIAILEENVTNTEAQQTYEELPTIQTDETICKAFEEQVTQLEQRNNELEDKVMYLEKELESVSMSALEMHTLLENSLATQVNSKTTENEVDVLRTLTETQENKIEELRNEMDSILIENQCLKEDNEHLKTSLKKLEGECNNQIKKNLELSEKNRNLTLQLDRQIESNSSMESNYKSELYQLRSKLDDMAMNLKRAEFQVEELNRVNGTTFLDKFDGKPSDELRILYDGSQLKIQISTLEAMNNDLTAQLKEEKNARRMLDEHIGDVIKELNNLKKNFEINEKEKNEAVTKLNVLTDYFKDKETKLHKELEIKEKMFVECEGKDQLLSQKLSSLKDEISNYKIRNENLEKEILDQERSYKSQLANAEQKTREHWFELRQMERKYKETEKEAASLRNKLLILERQKSDEKANMINGDMPAVPMYPPPISPDLLPYPAPPDFIPPPPSPIASHPMEFFPPEPLYSPDERLSPLGGRRVPTPPFLMPNDDFMPPPPDSKYMSGRNRHEPPAPSSYLRTSNLSSRHRPQFQSRQQRNSLDSPSSGMSLESLDRTGR